MDNEHDLVEVDGLFAIPIYKAILNFNDDEWDSIQNTIKNFHYVKYTQNEFLVGKKTGEGSEDQKVLIHPKFEILRKKIDYHLNNFLFDILKIQNTKFSHSNSWINKHLYGDYSPSHMHTNSTFSGIFYLTVPSGDSGNIVFYSKHNTISTETFGYDISEYNILNSKTWEYQPQNKLLFIFPSHLPHSVSENNTNEERYSLAFNYFVDGQVGYPTQQINLKVL